MLRRGRIAGQATPALPAILRNVDAALIRRPHLSCSCAGTKQRCDRARYLWPSVAHALPALPTDTAIESPVRSTGDIRAVRPGRCRYHDAFRLFWIDGDAAQVADFVTGARRAPISAGIVALEIAVAGGDAQSIRSLEMDGE